MILILLRTKQYGEKRKDLGGFGGDELVGCDGDGSPITLSREEDDKSMDFAQSSVARC